MIKYKAIIIYVSTSDSVQHVRRCIQILDAIPLSATVKFSNFTLEEVDKLINIDYGIDV